MKHVVNFLQMHSSILFAGTFASLTIFFVANLLNNPYRKDNKRLNAFVRKTLFDTSATGENLRLLPEAYRRQWRAYLHGNAASPSVIFEFAAVCFRPVLLSLYALSCLASVAYLILFISRPVAREYLAFPLLFGMCSAYMFTVLHYTQKANKQRAIRLFGKAVAILNKYARLGKSNVADTDKTVAELNKLRSYAATDELLQRASQILREGCPAEQRSPDDQRRINLALNGLLQAHCQRMRAKSA